MTLHEISRALMADGKGIFIADEGMNSGSKLFVRCGVSESPENYAKYRELIFGTEGIEEMISGALLPVDAFVDMGTDGRPLYEMALSKKILLGIAYEGAHEELGATLAQLKSSGAAFCMTRMTHTVEMGASDAFKESVRDSISFVKTCHENGYAALVVIDVSTDGPQTAAQAEDAITESLSLLSDALESSGVDMKGVIVASSMAVAGKLNPLPADAKEVGERTARAVTSSLPSGLAGVVFLSDSQSAEEATGNMNAISRMEPFVWPIAFAFSDAFEEPVIKAWQGKEENVDQAQAVLSERLSLADAADRGGYSAAMEL